MADEDRDRDGVREGISRCTTSEGLQVNIFRSPKCLGTSQFGPARTMTDPLISLEVDVSIRVAAQQQGYS